MEVFYGHTGFSFIDVWALVHFAFWIFVGSCAWSFARKIRWRFVYPVTLFVCVAFAYAWEMVEMVLAPKYHGLWGDWFQYDGVCYMSVCVNWTLACHYESWWNSWISDPLMCIVGVLLIWRFLDWKSV